jgi:hypothetical protein
MHGTNNCPKCGRDLCVCNRKPSDRPERVAERVRLHRRLAVFKRIGDTYNALPPEIRTSVIDHMIASGIADVDLVRNEFELCRMLAERWGISRPGLLRCGPHQLALGAYDADQERIEREALRRKSRDSRGWKKGVWTGARAGEPWGQRAIQPPAIPTTARELSDARVRGQAGA